MGNSAERFIADVQASSYHLRLISEPAAPGCTAIVYDLRTKKVLFKESAENLEASKAKAESFARELVSGKLTIVWQHITA
jgi:hypothetical protein